MSKPFRLFNNVHIRWQDKNGNVHAVEGSEVHPGIRLLWTVCEIDVPADTAFLGEEAITCSACKHILQQETAK